MGIDYAAIEIAHNALNQWLSTLATATVIVINWKNIKVLFKKK